MSRRKLLGTCLHLSSTHALAVACRRHRALSQVKSAQSFSEYAQLPAASQRHSCQQVPRASGLPPAHFHHHRVPANKAAHFCKWSRAAPYWLTDACFNMRAMKGKPNPCGGAKRWFLTQGMRGTFGRGMRSKTSW